MKITDKVFINITSKESENGCQRIIDEGGLTKPILVDIPAKIQNGMVLEIENAEYANGESIITQPLYATIIVKKTRAEVDAENAANQQITGKARKKMPIWIIIAAILVIAGVCLFFWLR